MLKSATEKLLNSELIIDEPKHFSFIQVQVNEEDQTESLTK